MHSWDPDPYPRVYRLTEYIPGFVQVVTQICGSSTHKTAGTHDRSGSSKYSQVLMSTHRYLWHNQWMAIKEHYTKLQVHQILQKTLPKHYCSLAACSFLWKLLWSHLAPQHQGGHTMPLALMLLMYSCLKVSDTSLIQSNCHGKMHILHQLM